MPQAPYGLDTTHQYRPFDWTKQRKRYDPTTDPENYSDLMDSYRDGYLGAVGNFMERELAGGSAPPGWDPLDNIPVGYEDFTASFINVRTPEMLEIVRQQIDDRLANNARREKRGIGATIAADLVAGIIDPTNLLAGPVLKGAGFLAGSAKGALFIGSMGAGQEAAVWALEPGITHEEGRARVLGGAIGGILLGGVLGGVVGGVTSRAAAHAAPTQARQMSRSQIINFVQHQLEGGDRLVDNQDGAGWTKYGLTQKFNPELGDVTKVTFDQAQAHAQKKYWLPEFDKADPRIAAIAFDAHYINSKKTARKILKAKSVEEALRIYRNQLMWIADNVEGKAQFRKGWNNRIDRLTKFVGGGSQSRIIAGARQPKGIMMDDRGYMKIRKGFTNNYDKDGNYIPAGLMRRRRAPTDDNTLVAMEERAGRYETLERRAARQANNKKPTFEIDVPNAPKTINRPRVRETETPDDVMPRTINDDVDAAIDLDRLERGDAEAARITADLVRGRSAARAPGKFDNTVEDYVQRYMRGEGRDDLEMQQFAANNAEVIEAEFHRVKEAGEGPKNLPFVLEQAAKKLPKKDAAFLTNVVEAKGLLGMSQPERDQLAHIVAKLPKIDPDAAKMWMGSGYKGGALTPYDVAMRLDSLVATRKQRKDMAPQYERDVALNDYDRIRDELDLAMDEVVYNIGKASDEIERIRLERKAKVQEQVDDLHPNLPNRKETIIEIKKAWNAEYANAIALAKEQRYRLQDLQREIIAERNKHFGTDKNVGGNDDFWGKAVGGGESPETALTVGDNGILWNKQTGERIKGGFFGRLEGEAVSPKLKDLEPPEDLKAIWAHDKEKMDLIGYWATSTEPGVARGMKSKSSKSRAPKEASTEEPGEIITDYWVPYDSGQIRLRLQEMQDELLAMEAGQERRGSYGEIITIPFSTKKSKGAKMSQAALHRQKLENMNKLRNRLHEVEAFEKEESDFLPFRVPERGREPGPKDLEDPNAEYIAIDVDALLASFPDKPWMQSVHGLPGMAEDAFDTAENWVNFVFLHEMEHVQNPRMKGEDIGAYEQRINDRAMIALDAGDAPWKPIDDWKQRLVLAPTPIGELMRIVANPMNYMWKSIATIGGDYDLRLQRNLVEGGASQAGGSVFQKAMRHTAKAAEFFHFESNHYIEHVTGRQSDWGSVGVAYSVWRASKKAAGKGKLTWEEFDRAVGRVQMTGKLSGDKNIDAAAAKFNEIVEDVRKQAEELGILPGKEKFELEANAIRSTINSLEQLQNRGAKGDAMLVRLYDDLERAEARIKMPRQVPGTKGLPYFTRVWNPAAMMRNPEEIKRIFREAYQRQGDSVQDAAASAEATYQKLIEDPTSQSIEIAAQAGEFRSREIPVENDEVMDFIHQDAHIILARYMRHTGGAIEMTRAFGDAAGLLEENRIYAALEADGLSEGKIEAALQIWQDVRDRVIGGFHGENPMSTSNRLVRFSKRWTRMATMGMSGITQITDLARAMWVTGPNSFAKGLFSPMFMQMEGYDPGTYAKAVGESLEIEMGLMARRMMDDDDWTMRVSETGIEKLMGDLDVPFFIVNGVTPFTNLVKRAVARATPHITIDRARRVTAAIHAGKEPPAEDAIWLRGMGIDEHDAQLLAKLPVEESKGGFIMVNLDEWAALGPQGARGKDLLMGVISGHTRRAVATPGPLNRPRIMDGIMINKKDRSQAWADRWAAESAENDARAYVKKLRREGLGEGDADFDKAVEQLVQAAGVHKRAQLGTGTKGRKERPFMSLPFQLQSFAFSQSAKLTSAVLSGRDKNVLFGLAGMWGAGIMVNWLKGTIAGTNDNATLDEHIMRGFMNSGLLSWMSIPVQAANGLLSVAVGEQNFGPVNLVRKDMPGVTDQTGFLGPALNLGIGTMEAMFGKGFDGKDLAPSERAYQLRKILPFGNLLYWNWLVRMAVDAAVPKGETSHLALAQSSDDEYGKTIEGMMGFTYGDVDPRSPMPEVANSKEVELDAMDIEPLLAGMLKKKGRKGRAPKVGDTLVIDKFNPSSNPKYAQGADAVINRTAKQRAPKVGDTLLIDKFR